MMYRNFVISYDPPPIPTRGCDWHAVHDDFDGAPDSNDGRYFHGPTEADVKAQVDDWWAEQEEVPSTPAHSFDQAALALLRRWETTTGNTRDGSWWQRWTADVKALLAMAGPETPAEQPPAADQQQAGEAPPLTFGYRNWYGEDSVRKVKPIYIWFGATEWHPEPQWLLTAIDVEKHERRDFAMKDMVPYSGHSIDGSYTPSDAWLDRGPTGDRP